MSESLYCDGQKTLSAEGKYNWYRTFKGYPDINDDVFKMIAGFKDSPKKLLLFFIEYVTNDGEYANFLTHEVINGSWKR